MKYVMMFSICAMLFSCKNVNDKKGKVAFQQVTDTTYLDKKGNSYKFLASIPDSLRTSEQQMIIEKIREVARKYISVKGNKMVLDLSKEEFLEMGLSERYYNMTVKNIYDNNREFDSLGIKDVDKMIDKLKSDLAK